jgi:hypothetical protein
MDPSPPNLNTSIGFPVATILADQVTYPSLSVGNYICYAFFNAAIAFGPPIVPCQPILSATTPLTGAATENAGITSNLAVCHSMCIFTNPVVQDVTVDYGPIIAQLLAPSVPGNEFVWLSQLTGVPDAY